MQQRITIINGSPRKNGNTSALVKAFCEGAISAGHKVTIINISDYKVSPCLGCNCCFADKCCIQNDDMQKIYGILAQTDVLVIATPVYFYGVSAQIKTIIDRLHNPIRDDFNIKKLGLIAVGAASLPELFDAILTEYRLALNFFKLTSIGEVLVRKMQKPGDVINSPAIKEANSLGCKI